MQEFRIIKPEKIIDARGNRSRKEIADASHGKITEQDLYNYEKGLNMPRREKEPYLAIALGVKFEDISEKLEVEIAA